MAPYEVLKSHEGWEERSMPALKWISGDGFDIRPHDGESAQRVSKTIGGILYIALFLIKM